jgi:hypothetical protein
MVWTVKAAVLGDNCGEAAAISKKETASRRNGWLYIGKTR